MEIKIRNSRIEIEDLFGGAVKASGIEARIIQLSDVSENLYQKYIKQNPDLGLRLQSIRKITQECECFSMLSLEVSWEIASRLITDILQLLNHSKEAFESFFPGLNQAIIAIEEAMESIYDLINMKLEDNFSIKQPQLSFNRRFPASCIFA